MILDTVWCGVIRANVTRVTDFEGRVTSVICPEYAPGGRCGLKAAAGQGGPLARLLERAAEGTLEEHGTRCDLAAE